MVKTFGLSLLVPFLLFSSHGYLGVEVKTLLPEDARDIGLPQDGGIKVLRVLEETPAEDAGLKEGDIILKYGKETVESAPQLIRLVRETPPGKEVTLKIFREGKTLSLAVKVGSRDGEAFLPWGEFWRGRDWKELMDRLTCYLPQGPALGIQAYPLTKALADALNLPVEEGLLVVEVEGDSPAEKGGIQPGDIIVQVEASPVADLCELKKALKKHAGTVSLTLYRRGKKKRVEVRFPKRRGFFYSYPWGVEVFSRKRGLSPTYHHPPSAIATGTL